jgi:type II secretory ATPase GspE/PulE/Tfp pilus assembly ATPase PilB-like protein
MVLPHDRTGSRNGRAIQAQPSPQQHNGATSEIDRDKAFQLIDRILPFEACLYYQILPLALDGSRLRLGMVNLADSAALDYVRRILAYLHCSLAPQNIPSDVHYSTLSAYLNYSGKAQQAISALNEERPAAVPPEVEAAIAPVTSEPVTPSPSSLVQHATPEIEKAQRRSPMTPDERATLLLERSDDSTTGAAATATVSQSFETLPPPQLPPPGNALPVLELTLAHLESPIEQLAGLPPDQLLQELLGRVLDSGIGRLYFERNAQGGRILWSKDGVLRSVLDDLPAAVLQALIDALKQLTHVDATPVQTPRQVEVERLYQKDRLLLRLRLMTNDYGEEATFQVLRGPALKFYQQQQLLHLSRNALGMARSLYQKVSELRDRTHEPVPSEQMLVMTEIDRVIRKVNQQLADLQERPVAKGGSEFRSAKGSP